MLNGIQTAYKCKVCSEFIVGVYHEFISCSCDKVHIDEGSMRDRLVGDLIFARDNWENYCLDKDSTIEERLDKMLFGTYTKDEKGESLLKLWNDKKPKAVVEYNETITADSPYLRDVLSEEENKEYDKWLSKIPKKDYVLIKDIKSDEMLEILDDNPFMADKFSDIFKTELENRGIDISHI